MSAPKGNAPFVTATEASSVSETPKKGTNMSDSTQVTPLSAITPDLTVVDGHVTTTSNQIAAHFGTRHTNVLRAIDNLLAELSPDHRLNFEPMVREVGIGDGAVRKDRAYRMTRDGFTLLAMGFTGKEATQWKVAYIDAFNRMEAELLRLAPAQPQIDYRRISPAQAQTLKEHVERVVESGLQTFGETWKRLHKKFRVNSYHELPASKFAEACAYLEGKLPKGYNFPLSTADVHDRQMASTWLTPARLMDPKNRSPELELIAALERDGHDVMGAKIRILAMREAMDQVEDTQAALRQVLEKLGPLVETCKVGLFQRGKNVLFRGQVDVDSPVERHVYRDQIRQTALTAR